ncbi:MAG: CYTH domain-containing protein [Candidatus Saccharibacteria bacterium]|nr:CYTH domain-containing protein [Candidatus Saccharibacteria bacterium]
MKKVIVKCRLKSEREFRAKLAEISLDFEERVWQHDRVYLPRGYRRGENLPRIIVRTEMSKAEEEPKYFLILKRHIEDSDLEIIDQTEVKDYLETVRIAQQLGFEKKAEVSRAREKIVVSEKMELILDKIDGLEGRYVKIEMILEEGESVRELTRETRNTLKILGCEKDSFVEKAYFEM